jgi:hypothetical protein
VYEPVNDKVFISRDIVFDESKGWNWKSNSQSIQQIPGGVDDSSSHDENIITPTTEDVVNNDDEVEIT